ncbi:hypothetical protein CTI12_AA052790 [Artemisia annua]|uniref:Uncharacterized protein n=1 Tax=Artemisia annua TaxID=35608 RepID=A0A2U1N6P4_ARTAN|nr:hypothetical protein CTI12_AA052790 [Artemisia annua]
MHLYSSLSLILLDKTYVKPPCAYTIGPSSDPENVRTWVHQDWGKLEVVLYLYGGGKNGSEILGDKRNGSKWKEED